MIARPPVFGGLVKAMNADKVKAVPGVTHVVELASGVGQLLTHAHEPSEEAAERHHFGGLRAERRLPARRVGHRVVRRLELGLDALEQRQRGRGRLPGLAPRAHTLAAHFERALIEQRLTAVEAEPK